MSLLSRLAARIVGFVLFVSLAAACGAVAVFSIDTGSGGASLGHLARDLHLASVRRTVGHWLMRLEHGNAVALLAAVCGLAAIALGTVLLSGGVGRRRERLLILATGDAGTLSARRRALSAIAQALAEDTHGVTAARAKITRTRTGDTVLRVRVTHPRHSTVDDVRESLHRRLRDLTEPFGIRENVEIDRDGRRVQ